jgi:very-short-patch-repair endonuclease
MAIVFDTLLCGAGEREDNWRNLMSGQYSESHAIEETVKKQSIRFLEYLSAVARELGTSPIYDMHHEDLFTPITDVAVPNRYLQYGPAESRPAWLTVLKTPKPAPPTINGELRSLIDQKTICSPSATPALSAILLQQQRERIRHDAQRKAEESFGTTQGEYQDHDPDSTSDHANTEFQHELLRRIDDFNAHAEQLLQEWLETTWKPWCETNRPIFATRKLYDRLYDLYLRYEAERDSKEIIWGNAIFHYDKRPEVRNSGGFTSKDEENSNVHVDYPIIITSMNIQIDQNNGSISLIPDVNSALNLATLEGIGLSGINALTDLQQQIRNGDTLIDIWDDDNRKTMENHIVAPLGNDAEVVDHVKSLTRPTSPIVSDESVLFIRSRPKREEQFYEELSKEIRDTDFLPEALDSVIIDNDVLSEISRENVEHFQTENSSSAADELNLDTIANRVLMPLPANEEQRRIARQITVNAGVTVQGPPGTGKTHTIANLVSHLLAQGKRVLVTAEKDQALRVLQDKIPEEIRNLSMAVIGSSPASMEHLKDSVQRMQDSLSTIDPASEDQQVKLLGQKIDTLQDQLRRCDNELQQVLASEQSEFILPNGSKRAGEVAEWVSNNHEVDVIPDDIALDTKFPLTIAEFDEFVHLCRVITPQEAAASTFDTTIARQFPDGPSIDRLFGEIASLRKKITALHESGLNIKAIDALDDQSVISLITSIETGMSEEESVDSDLEQQLFDSTIFNLTDLQWLRQQNAEILDQAQLGLDLDQHLLGHEISIPRGQEQSLLDYVGQWKNKLEDGKKIGIFSPRHLKDFATQVRLDGYEPTAPAQLDLIRDTIRARKLLRETSLKAREVYRRFNLPTFDTENESDFLQIFSQAKKIDKACAWCLTGRNQLDDELRPYIAMKNPSSSAEKLHLSHQLLSEVGIRRRERSLTRQLDALNTLCNSAINAEPDNILWKEFRQSLEARNSAQWNANFHKLTSLIAVHNRCIRRDLLGEKLTQAGAGLWKIAIIRSRGREQTYVSLDTLEESWLTAQAKTWLKRLHHGPSVDSIMQESSRLSTELQRLTIDLIRRSALAHLKRSTRDSERRALASWLEAIKRVGKGTGKNAPRFQAQARRLLPQAMGSVPVWIMPIYRVLENFVPGVSRPFDVVIVDESSQCDLLTVGVLALAKKAIIVGDDKQTSPNLVGVKTERIFDLQTRYLSDLPDKTLFTHNTSLYALSDRAFRNTILLREHYRCVPEIIEYSNRFYNGQIQPLREHRHPAIGSPLRAIHLDAVSHRVNAHRVNEEEAQKVTNQVIECAKDSRYDGLTFGVVTMMSGPQSKIIETKLIKQLGNEEMERRRLRVGNPPDFQGDERDVIFISMVTDETQYSATTPMWQQWANVAVSRAREQLWVFYSMEPDTLNASDMRRSIIDYVTGFHYEEDPRDLFQMTESKFERDVLQDLLRHGYEVKPQYRVGGYRIDFVVTVASGYRLAIECDGDSFHGPEQLKDDIRRQRVLERLGWNFWRIRASEYYLDREKAMLSLWQRLDDLRTQAGNLAVRTLSTTPKSVGSFRSFVDTDSSTEI